MDIFFESKKKTKKGLKKNILQLFGNLWPRNVSMINCLIENTYTSLYVCVCVCALLIQILHLSLFWVIFKFQPAVQRERYREIDIERFSHREVHSMVSLEAHGLKCELLSLFVVVVVVGAVVAAAAALQLL